MGLSIRLTSLPGEGANPIRLVRTSLRRCIADEVERLIAILDEFDGDADREDGANAEPYLGWPEGRPHAEGLCDDREADAGEEREPDADREWSLGSLQGEDQRGWALGLGRDREHGE